MPLDNDTPAILRPQIVLPILAFLVLVVVLAFLVFRPFILDFVVAASVALLLAPAQRRLSGVFGGRAALAAASLVLATTVMILLPVVSSLVILGQQALDAFAWLGPRLQPAALQTFWDVLKDKKSVFVGTGLPMIAAMLAQRTHAPNLLLFFEAGGIGPEMPVLPISVGDSRTFYHAVAASSMHDSMSMAQAGYIDY